MAIRNVYGIRTSLARSMLDSQIQLGGNISWSVAKRPITLANFIYVMFAIFGFAVIFSHSVVRYGNIWEKILFAIGYISTYVCLLTRTKTIDYKISYLPVFFTYWRRGGRYVRTGLLDPGGPVKNLLGIEPVHGVDQDGTIHFTNGEVGRVYSVVGNASAMIFKADQDQVIDDARTIYKNLPSMTGLTLITQASVQDVHTQIDSKEEQLQNLQIDSPGLRQIVKKQALVLRDRVGSQFSMIRQYLLIRGTESNVKIESSIIEQAADSATNAYLKSAHKMTNEPPVYNSRHMKMNEPYEVTRLLKSIFDDVPVDVNAVQH